MNKNRNKGRPIKGNFLLKNKAIDKQESRKEPLEIKICADCEKPKRNRCCLVQPKQVDFGQITEWGSNDGIGRVVIPTNQQYGYNSLLPSLSAHLNTMKTMLVGTRTKAEGSSQYNDDGALSMPKYAETTDSLQWETVDNVDDIELLLRKTVNERLIEPRPRPVPQRIGISEVPKVKVIAEKYSKYKRDNVELRRLDEKVVCVEYDVFEQGIGLAKPIQKMRAFFSIKPVYEGDLDSPPLAEVPSKVKHTFNISDEDLKKLTEKEIEIIDEKIEENKSYLENLKLILKRKQFVSNDTKKNTSLDLKYLYEMAKRDALWSDSNEFLSKEVLHEVKNLILEKCTSSMHGITRKRMKSPNERKLDSGVLSSSIVSELLREDGNINVFN